MASPSALSSQCFLISSVVSPVTYDLEAPSLISKQSGIFQLYLCFYFQLNSTGAREPSLSGFNSLEHVETHSMADALHAGRKNVDSALSRAVVCVTCHLGRACQSCCSNFHILSDVLSAWQVSRGERWLNLPLWFWISLRFQVGRFWFRTGYGIGASLALWHLLEHWSFPHTPQLVSSRASGWTSACRALGALPSGHVCTFDLFPLS